MQGCHAIATRYTSIKLLHVRVMVGQVSWEFGGAQLLQRAAGAPVLKQESLAIL